VDACSYRAAPILLKRFCTTTMSPDVESRLQTATLSPQLTDSDMGTVEAPRLPIGLRALRHCCRKIVSMTRRLAWVLDLAGGKFSLRDARISHVD
jgi:hypothetical protein